MFLENQLRVPRKQPKNAGGTLDKSFQKITDEGHQTNVLRNYFSDAMFLEIIFQRVLSKITDESKCANDKTDNDESHLAKLLNDNDESILVYSIVDND